MGLKESYNRTHTCMHKTLTHIRSYENMYEADRLLKTAGELVHYSPHEFLLNEHFLNFQASHIDQICTVGTQTQSPPIATHLLHMHEMKHRWENF